MPTELYPSINRNEQCLTGHIHFTGICLFPFVRWLELSCIIWISTDENPEVIWGERRGPNFCIQNAEFRVRSAMEAASSFANICLAESEQITHSRSFPFLLQANGEDISELKVKRCPSSYHTTICHVHLSYGSLKVMQQENRGASALNCNTMCTPPN